MYSDCSLQDVFFDGWEDLILKHISPFPTQREWENANSDIQDALISHTLTVRTNRKNVISLNVCSSTAYSLVSSH